jgi:hypothetical protein
MPTMAPNQLFIADGPLSRFPAESSSYDTDLHGLP